MLVCRSFHGTLRVLEIGEAVVALIVYVVGFFVPEWEKPLKGLFVVLVGLLVLTFFFGLFLAAYAAQREEQDKRIEAEKRLSTPKVDKRTAFLRHQLDEFLKEGNNLVGWLKSGKGDLVRNSLEALQVWEHHTKSAVMDYHADYYPAFLENPLKDALDSAIRTMHLDVPGVVGYLEEQMRKLREIQPGASAQ